jgi:hypothetical protein
MRLFSKVLWGLAAGSVAFAMAATGEPLPDRASLFGIVLGSPLSLPACPTGIFGVNVRSLSEMCESPSKPGSPSFQIYFATDNAPRFLQTDANQVTLRNGAVDKINLFTHGVRDQNEVLAALRKKFGDPTHITTDSASNMMGAKFDVVSAEWDLPSGDQVVFAGALNKFDVGAIIAMTAAAAADVDAQGRAHSGPAL